MRKRFKKVVAVSMAATMVMGSTLVAFAEDSTGTGSFEGVEPELPAYTAITLPTAAAGTYNYIADPAGLIRKYADDTTKAKLPAADKDTGIYFTDKDGKYSADSKEIEITNENAVDVDVTVKVEVTDAEYDDLTFSSTGAWTSADKDNELYIAAVHDTDKEAVTDTAAAQLKFTIDGTDDNYEVKRTVGSDGKATYAYEKKSGTLTWEKESFNLTGAINKNAEWKDGTITVPEIKVTWTAAAHTDVVATSFAYTSKAANGDVTLTFTPGTDAKTLAKTSFIINGVQTSAWSSFRTNIIFNDDNTVTVKAAVFGFSSIANATTDDKYTFTVVDTDGTSYSTAETVITQ